MQWPEGNILGKTENEPLQISGGCFSGTFYYMWILNLFNKSSYPTFDYIIWECIYSPKWKWHTRCDPGLARCVVLTRYRSENRISSDPNIPSVPSSPFLIDASALLPRNRCWVIQRHQSRWAHVKHWNTPQTKKAQWNTGNVFVCWFPEKKNVGRV